MTTLEKISACAFAAFALLAAGCNAPERQAAPKERVLLAENGTIHRFFDTSPISPSGKYAALFRLPYENKKPQAGDAGDVIVVELASGREIFSTKSRGWETQMGANVQWGATDAELFYNDVDTETWDGFAVKLDFKTGKKSQPSAAPTLPLRGRGLGRWARLPVAGAHWGYNHIPQLGLLAAHGGAGRKRGGAISAVVRCTCAPLGTWLSWAGLG